MTFPMSFGGLFQLITSMERVQVRRACLLCAVMFAIRIYSYACSMLRYAVYAYIYKCYVHVVICYTYE